MAREQLGNKPCGGRFSSAIDSIGNTPLVELPTFSPKDGVRIWAKLEGRNPTGSVKDRVARSMIEDAEARGAIEPGKTILEPTSGNTGISLAMICSVKGYPLKVVMPDNVTEERTQLLQMYGAEIVYSEGAKGSNGAVEVALEMAEEDQYFMPYQYGNEANPRAHYDGTALEILEELDEVAAFVGGLGTGGTLMGNGRRLKEHDPETKIVAAEPMQGELVQGLRSLDDGFIPPIIDISLFDRKIMVSNHDAIVWTKKLLAEEGLFAGVSSGAIAYVADRIGSELDGGNVVFLVPDDGWNTSAPASTPNPSRSWRTWTPPSGGRRERAGHHDRRVGPHRDRSRGPGSRGELLSGCDGARAHPPAVGPTSGSGRERQRGRRFPRRRRERSRPARDPSHRISHRPRELRGGSGAFGHRGVEFRFSDHGISHSIYFQDPTGTGLS